MCLGVMAYISIWAALTGESFVVQGHFEQGLGRKLGRVLESQHLASLPENLVKRSMLGRG